MANSEAGSANKKVIMIAVIVVLIIAAVAGGAVFMMSKNQPKPEELLFYSPGEPFVTNLKDSNSLVKVTVTVAYNEKKATEDLTTNNAVIRNAIVFVLRNKNKDDFKAADIETTLSNEICQKLNNELGVSYFVKIYFSDLVVQG